MRELERRVILSVLDRKWREHLYEMDYLREGIYLRAYSQRDPLVEYQREGFDMFAAMMDGIKEESVGFLFNLQVEVTEDDGRRRGRADHVHDHDHDHEPAPAGAGRRGARDRHGRGAGPRPAVPGQGPRAQGAADQPGLLRAPRGRRGRGQRPRPSPTSTPAWAATTCAPAARARSSSGATAPPAGPPAAPRWAADRPSLRTMAGSPHAGSGRRRAGARPARAVSVTRARRGGWPPLLGVYAAPLAVAVSGDFLALDGGWHRSAGEPGAPAAQPKTRATHCQRPSRASKRAARARERWPWRTRAQTSSASAATRLVRTERRPWDGRHRGPGRRGRGAGRRGHGRGPAAELLVEPVLGVAQQLAQRPVAHGDLDRRAEVAVHEGVEPVAPLAVHGAPGRSGARPARVDLRRVEPRRQVEGERALHAGHRHRRGGSG